ncbi:hypothetical protein [Wenzhouxiangella marina]|nr:hypothetical protein [Wenzhouxiangella marina]
MACCASVQAQLAGLVHDETNGSLRVVSIDSATGNVAAGAGEVADCCRLGGGLVAADVAGERFFAIGVWSGGDNADQIGLFELAFDGSAVASQFLGAVPTGALEWDSLNARLITVSVPDFTSGLQLQSIDPTTGSIQNIGSATPDCCEILTGVSTIDPAGQRLFFAGRANGEADWAVYGVDLGTGEVNNAELLPSGHPGFMAFNPSLGTVDVLMQQTLSGGTQIIAVDVDNGGAIILAEHENSDCCHFELGQTPSLSEDGDSWWLSGRDSALQTSLVAMGSAGINAVTTTRAITSGYLLRAVVVNGETLSLDQIFRDRFEL